MSNYKVPTSKEELKEMVETCLRNYPQISTHYSETVGSLFLDLKRDLLNLLEIPLVRHAVIAPENLKNLESYIQEHAFTNIEAPLERLKSNFSEYPSILAELHAAKLLKEEGMTDIKFITAQGSPDIEYLDNEIKRYAEVKKLDDLDPSFNILHNKLQAKSVLDSNFCRSFYIQCEYDFIDFESILDVHEGLRKAGDILINKLSEIRPLQFDHQKFEINEFKFEVSIRGEDDEFRYMQSGGVKVYSSSKDFFPGLQSVYSRYINNFNKAYKQLLKVRNDNKELVSKDRIYFFLNVESYANIFPNEVRSIFEQLSKILGMSNLAEIKIIY